MGGKRNSFLLPAACDILAGGTCGAQTALWYRPMVDGGFVVTFQEVLAQVITWLEHDKRLSYRAYSGSLTWMRHTLTT